MYGIMEILYRRVDNKKRVKGSNSSKSQPLRTLYADWFRQRGLLPNVISAVQRDFDNNYYAYFDECDLPEGVTKTELEENWFKDMNYYPVKKAL